MIGRIPSVMDENTVPTVQLQRLDRAPYRGEPFACAGFGSNDGAVAPDFNWAGVRVPSGDRGVLLVHSIRVFAREAVQAAATNVLYQLAVGTGPQTNTNIVYSVEPVATGGASTVRPLPPTMVLADSTLAALTGALIAEYVELRGNAVGAHVWRFARPVVLTADTWLLGAVIAFDAGGVAPVEVGVSIEGEYFPLRER